MRRVGRSALALGLAFGSSVGCGEPPATVSGDSTTTETSSSSGADTSDSDSGGSESGIVPSVGQPLVMAEAWVRATAEDDPLRAERPEDVQCDLGWGVETGAFEVDTELCLYGAFTQPTLAEIHAGDTIEMLILHDSLYATEPATAHLAIAFGEDTAWELEIPIPSEPGIVRPSWAAPSDVPLGTPVVFHVHNHGANNYRLIELTVASP